MADDKDTPENKRIIMTDDRQLLEVAERLGVTRHDVLRAIMSVGASMAAVEAYLRSREKK